MLNLPVRTLAELEEGSGVGSVGYAVVDVGVPCPFEESVDQDGLFVGLNGACG